ncbi:hypothetical protein D1872_306050 [compost metagenome]
MQILLVVVFRIVERCRGGDFGGDLACIARGLHRLLEAGQAGARGGVLLWRQRINGGTILSSVIVTLLHALGRVVVFPENLQ